MWVQRSLSASRVLSRRFLSLFAISTLMVVLAVTGPLSQVALAADAIWTGTTLTYDGKVHTETTSAPDRAGEPNEFEWRLNTGGPTIATVLYFGNNPGNQKEATLVEYDILNGNYTQSSPPQTVSVTRDLTVDDQGSAESVAGTTCNVTGIGWIICPLASWMSDGVDWVYGIIASFLEVQTITTSDSGVYQVWQLIRNIANICFLFVFLAIVYSQLTGIGFSSHNIKDMIPRLVIGAALVNVSFWICALAVDASNLLGYSIQSIFVTVRENLVMNPAISGENFTWAGITAVILGGGAASIAGIGAATAGSGISMSFLLISALLPAAFAVLVAFVILAARQALIVVLTMVSPLAFVAFVLPSTQNLFDKWRNAFTTLLVFFPIFAFVFGGSQLAGTAILNSSQDAQPAMQLPLILIGMATIVVPLVITPLLIRFSTGVLRAVANLANNNSRGLMDRSRGWARDNAEMHKTNKLAKSDSRANIRRPYTMLSPSRLGRRMDYNKRRRDAIKGLNEEVLAARQDRDWEESLHTPAGPGRVRSRLGVQSPEERRHGIHAEADTLQRKAKSFKDDHHARAENRWNTYLQDTSGTVGDGQGARYRGLKTSTHEFTGRAKLSEEDMTNADELAFRALVHRTPVLRQQSQRATVSSKEAAAYQEEIDTAANEQWTNRQSSVGNLRNMRSRTELSKQRTEAIDKSMSAADQLRFDEQVRVNPTYAPIRQAKIQTTIDTKEASTYQDNLDSVAQERWIQRQEANPGLRTMRTDTTLRQGRTEAIDKSMSAADQRQFDELVNTSNNPGYLRVRDAKLQTTVDSGHSDLQTKRLDAEGKKRFRDEFKDEAPTGRGLQEIVTQTTMYEKEADEVESMVKDRAETRWERQSRQDPDMQRVRLKSQQASDSKKKAELQWQQIIEESRAHGKEAAGILDGNEGLAKSIQNRAVSISARESAVENLKDDQKAHLLKSLNESEQLQQIAGGGTQYGATKVLAKTQSGLTQMILENAKAMTSIYSNDGYSVDEMFKAMNPNGVLRGGKEADDVAKFAAIQHVMENIGNNWAVEKTIDRMIREHGMYVEKDADGNAVVDPSTGEPIYYDAQDYFQNGAAAQRLDKSEVTSRRDTLQMVVDGYRKGKNKVSWMSATMQESLNRGITNIIPPVASEFGADIDASAAAIITEARSGKYEGGRIAAMDPDELSRMIQLFRNKEFREALSPQQRENIINAINKAQTSEQTRYSIKDRERGLMNAVANWLELGDSDNPPTVDDERELENYYYEEERRDGDAAYSVRVPAGTEGARRVWAPVAAPTTYNPDRQDDIMPSNTGLFTPDDKRPKRDPASEEPESS